MTVVILEDAAEDLESGAQFYESCATGVGDYFLDSILSDVDSLVLFAGVHPIYFQFHRMLSKRFPFLRIRQRPGKLLRAVRQADYSERRHQGVLRRGPV